jgi:2-dehydropantoate 2-reductase
MCSTIAIFVWADYGITEMIHIQPLFLLVVILIAPRYHPIEAWTSSPLTKHFSAVRYRRMYRPNHVHGCCDPLLQRFCASSTNSYDQEYQYDTITERDIEQLPYSSPARPQRVAVVGVGAVGSYYGARLWESGHDIHFLLRNENFDAATKDGLTVTSVEGDIHIPSDRLNAYRTTGDMAAATSLSREQPSPPDFDWVIVSLKSSALGAIPDLILPLLSAEKTRVLVIMNGMIEEDLLQLMRIKTGQTDDGEPLQCCHSWYGGMALICCNRIAPAVVDHSYFGLLSAGVASTKSKDDASNQRAFEELFQRTKIDVFYEDSLLRGRWKKMVWNLPFNGIAVAMGGITVDQIVQDPGLRQLAYHIMDETIAAANMDLSILYGEGNFTPLGVVERAAMMKLSDDMGPYKPSTMLDFVNRRSMEVQYLFRAPLDRARRLGVPVPHLETIVTQIEAYQRMYNLV